MEHHDWLQTRQDQGLMCLVGLGKNMGPALCPPGKKYLRKHSSQFCSQSGKETSPESLSCLSILDRESQDSIGKTRSRVWRWDVWAWWVPDKGRKFIASSPTSAWHCYAQSTHSNRKGK